ncbi:MAG TPA: prepilin-type N-terminal cleavage/methylation domain-containing protein [Verrucomicrobiae bacterium]|nr:prepilin-type N-terminal cleavage/methylation domain-containing protein [Verrucomicrobiae bacterium]
MKTQIKITGKSARAFTLLEVMIAIAIFFMSVFVILGLVSSVLANARHLQRPMVDAGMLASELSLTNQLVEETQSGDFGDAYPGYSWTANITEVQTNRLFEVDYQVFNDSKTLVKNMSVLFFRPQSPAGSLDGATVAK